MVKLLCGLLDPTEGRVLLNGTDIRIFNRNTYYDLFSAVFQEFSIWDVTVAEEIAQTTEGIDDTKVRDCIEKAGLTDAIEKLPQGLDTHIGREVYLDGVLFTGGQTQRLMLARALYKDGPILFLDEPTAALDPIAENDIYLKYGEMTRGKTPLFISHRVASTRFCDRILFLSDGAIKEEGTHEEATLGNRLFTHFGLYGLTRNRHRSADIRMYHQQRLVGAYLKQDTTFSANGPIAKLVQGKIGIYAGFGVSITALLTGFIYVFTCLKAWGGAFDVGSITQYVGAASAMAASVFALTQMFGDLETSAGYLEKTFAFLDIPNSMYKGSLTTEKRSDRKYEVEFKNVSFKYPGSDIWALKNVSMKFQVGKRLAVVGENGSGKTTFIKLLCRLYDPQEGQILLNGIDIKKYRYDDYMNIFSVVFQDFKLICQPLGANVAGRGTYDRDRVTKALIDAGFGDRLSSMEKGLDTMLSWKRKTASTMNFGMRRRSTIINKSVFVSDMAI